MIWTEFLTSTCKPKKVKKNPTCKPIKPDHPPAKPAQPTRPPEPIKGRLADGLSMNLFSTDGQRISPKPDPPDPNPPLILTIHSKGQKEGDQLAEMNFISCICCMVNIVGPSFIVSHFNMMTLEGFVASYSHLFVSLVGLQQWGMLRLTSSYRATYIVS